MSDLREKVALLEQKLLLKGRDESGKDLEQAAKRELTAFLLARIYDQLRPELELGRGQYLSIPVLQNNHEGDTGARAEQPSQSQFVGGPLEAHRFLPTES